MEGKHLRVFVACGTGLPFRRLLAATRALRQQRPELELFVQRGPDAEDFSDLPGSALIRREHFTERLRWADAVICHGGAGALYEACGSGHRPIAAARLARFNEHVNDHQLELVQALERRDLLVRWQEERQLALQVEPTRGAPRVRPERSLERAVAAALLKPTPEHSDDEVARASGERRTLLGRLFK